MKDLYIIGSQPKRLPFIKGAVISLKILDSVSNSVSAFLRKKGLEEENEIRTTALVVIDRLSC